MSNIEEIEKAVASLGPTELAIFSAWFERFEAERFYRRIEEDAEAGKLDHLAEAAVAEHRKDAHREL
jgi:hypothetical protein